jgi:hypothetical protein
MSDAIAAELRSLRGAKLLLAANGMLWIGLAAVWLARSPRGSSAAAYQDPLLATLMFGNAAILMKLASRPCASSGRLVWVGFSWVGVILMLSFTDEGGPADLIVGALYAVTLLLVAVLLRAHRRRSP